MLFNFKRIPPFRGSNRQVRGRILRFISEHGGMPVKELSSQLNTPLERILEITDQLCEEGFIKKNGRRITMA